MDWQDILVLGFFGVLSVFSILGAAFAWRADRYEDSDRHLRLQLAMFPFVNPSTVAIALVLTDVFLLFASTYLPGNTLSTVALVALLPLAVLCYTTWRLRRPRFMVPPWARGVPPEQEPSQPLVKKPASTSGRVKEGFMTLVAGLGFAALILGGIWFFAIPEADRYWGLLAAIVGVGAMVLVWLRTRGAGGES